MEMGIGWESVVPVTHLPTRYTLGLFVLPTKARNVASPIPLVPPTR